MSVRSPQRPINCGPGRAHSPPSRISIDKCKRPWSAPSEVWREATLVADRVRKLANKEELPSISESRTVAQIPTPVAAPSDQNAAKEDLGCKPSHSACAEWKPSDLAWAAVKAEEAKAALCVLRFYADKCATLKEEFSDRPSKERIDTEPPFRGTNADLNAWAEARGFPTVAINQLAAK